jgi:hypothetical protein
MTRTQQDLSMVAENGPERETLPSFTLASEEPMIGVAG